MIGEVNPDAQDVPFNDPQVAELDPETKLTATFEPEQKDTTFHLPALAISKRQESQYTVYIDGVEKYDAAIPPTDVDDLAATFLPPLTFESTLKVVVRNLSPTDRKRYEIQPVGWEEGGSN